MVCRGPRPPEHLTDATKDWWQHVTKDLDMTPHQLQLLRLSCEAWDRSPPARISAGKEQEAPTPTRKRRNRADRSRQMVAQAVRWLGAAYRRR